MAKGGNNHRSNGSRFTKPYDASNSFVKKVALRVSDYIGGLFGSSMKNDDSSTRDNAPIGRTIESTLIQPQYESSDSGKSIEMTRCFDDFGISESHGKRLKIGTKRKYVPDLPISPIASTSSLFQSSVNHNFDIQSSDEFITSVAGPSGLQNQKYGQTSSISTPTTSNTNIKANGATDNHSDSSESTSGCSSLVPQSDRLSQSAFVNNSRKKILEEKLQYARQLKQSRASMYLNRSIPVAYDNTGSKRKPSFDVSVYGSPILDKSSVREKMVNSPFYTGQTSYGGASAYRRARATLYPQQSGRGSFDRKDGLQIQVKPSPHGSTEDLSNMSHTAKRILEALEQFSTPINDAKRIPVSAGSPPLGSKRRRFGDSLESISTLSSTKLTDQVKGPLINGLNIPTVPDLLKLKRLEKIQDSTAAARQVSVQKEEYTLPTDVEPSKHTGKIVNKSKDKDKEKNFEKPQEVNLPKIPLPITTLPKFDFKLPPVATPPTQTDSSTATKPVKTISINTLPSTKAPEPSKTFKFSPPISLTAPENVKNSVQKSNFTFSMPLKADAIRDKSENAVLSNLSNFMSTEAMSKLKRKAAPAEKPNTSTVLEPAKELKAGSVMDLLRKTLESNKKPENESLTENLKPINDTWECDSCLLINLKDSKNCSGCKTPKSSVSTNKNVKPSVSTTSTVNAPVIDSKPITVTSGFGNKFKPPSDSWSCKECFVVNNSTSTKCIACENPRPQAKTATEPEPAPQVKPPPPVTSGFGDLFKKKAGQWECSVCMIRNKENDTKCAACETPKPGAKVDKPEPPKFNFGIPADAGGFKFGIDKVDAKSDGKGSEAAKPAAAQPNGPNSDNKPFSSVITSFGVYTFGIPQGVQQKSETESDSKQDNTKIEKEKPATQTKSETPVAAPELATKPLENKESETVSKPAETVVETKAADVFKSVPLPTNNLLTKPFTFGTQTQEKSAVAPVFSFGSQSNTLTPTTKPASMTDTNPAGSSTFQMMENTAKSSTNSMFGQCNAAPQFTFNAPAATSEVTKTSIFKFGASEKSEPSISTGSVQETAKATETVAEPFASAAPTTNSIFGKSMFKDSKLKVNFGSANNGSSISFGDSIKPAKPSEVASVTTAPFSMTTPIFSAASSAFNGPAVPAASTSTFGSITSATSVSPFNTNATKNAAGNTEQGFRPLANPSLPSTGISFGNPTTQVSEIFSPVFQETPSMNFGSGSTGFGVNPAAAPAPTFGSPFGQPASNPADKPVVTPFVFGDSGNKASTSAPAAPTTAPNVFTFEGSKSTNQFSGGFGQSSSTFTFGSKQPSSVFGSFNQPKTASPFGNSAPTFGASPFGQSSAPPAFDAGTPKFEFGSSFSQPSQSTPPQPFQFGATTPQTQTSNAPATTFSTSVPQTFNFTGGQPPKAFSAVPTEPPARRLVKAVRRMQRQEFSA